MPAEPDGHKAGGACHDNNHKLRVHTERNPSKYCGLPVAKEVDFEGKRLELFELVEWHLQQKHFSAGMGSCQRKKKK